MKSIDWKAAILFVVVIAGAILLANVAERKIQEMRAA